MADRSRWAIFYGDGTVFTSEDGEPFYAPSSNVQVVVQDGGLQSAKTAYYWKPEVGWCGCDEFGMHDYWQQYVGPKAVIFGRTIRNEDFWATMKRAQCWRDEHQAAS